MFFFLYPHLWQAVRPKPITKVYPETCKHKKQTNMFWWEPSVIHSFHIWYEPEHATSCNIATPRSGLGKLFPDQPYLWASRVPGLGSASENAMEKHSAHGEKTRFLANSPFNQHSSMVILWSSISNLSESNLRQPVKTTPASFWAGYSDIPIVSHHL